jgi:hypothetical protein
MRFRNDRAWIVSGLLAASGFIVFMMILNMGLFLSLLLGVAVFIGGVLLFRPRRFLVCGIDITKSQDKERAEREIEQWFSLQEKIKNYPAEDAWLRERLDNFSGGMDSVFTAMQTDANCLSAAELFLDAYLKTVLSLVEQYSRAGRTLDKIESRDYEVIRKKVKKNLQGTMDYFHDNLNKLLTLDVECITEFTSTLYQADGRT